MSDKGASGKTVANRYGFLSSALNAAVKAGRIPSNPAFEPALHTQSLSSGALGRQGISGRWLIRRRSYCR